MRQALHSVYAGHAGSMLLVCVLCLANTSSTSAKHVCCNRNCRDVLNKALLPRRSEFGLPEDKVIFSCSNQLYKYDPDTFTTWCNIFKRVPDR